MSKDQKDKIIKELVEKNEKLQDEVDSLWMMLDEITKSDIENWSSILEELNVSVAEKVLMITTKKADA
jgi:flagellar motor switch protein FliG